MLNTAGQEAIAQKGILGPRVPSAKKKVPLPEEYVPRTHDGYLSGLWVVVLKLCPS